MAEPMLCGRIHLALGVVMMAGLASCAGAPTPPRVQPVETSPVTGSFMTGTILATRSVDPGVDQNAVHPGFNEVMAALQEPAPVLSFSAKEFIVQQSNGSAVSVVTRVPGRNAAGSVSTADFSVGDQVEIVEGAQTELFHRN